MQRVGQGDGDNPSEFPSETLTSVERHTTSAQLIKHSILSVAAVTGFGNPDE